MTQTLIRYTDLYPARITPLPPGVPEGTKLRVVITDKYLTVGWIWGAGDIKRVDIPLDPGDVPEDVTYSGGTVRGYTVTRNGVCSTCGGGRRMTGWDPFPDASYVEEPRKQVEMAQRTGANRQMTGLIPPRYTGR